MKLKINKWQWQREQDISIRNELRGWAVSWPWGSRGGRKLCTGLSELVVSPLRQQTPREEADPACRTHQTQAAILAEEKVTRGWPREWIRRTGALKRAFQGDAVHSRGGWCVQPRWGLGDRKWCFLRFQTGQLGPDEDSWWRKGRVEGQSECNCLWSLIPVRAVRTFASGPFLVLPNQRKRESVFVVVVVLFFEEQVV